uniref:Galectin n=1 Tax=Xenopus tropicalis TaxID=8364 RepID=A0A803J3Z1_XENTR
WVCDVTSANKENVVYDLDSGFIPHTLVTVTGQVKPNAQRFSVNFKKENDVFLHFNPRYFEDVIVLNTCENGSWKSEERVKGNPIKKGSTFKVEFQCEENFFKIFLNGTFLVEFKARMHPITALTAIHTSGDVIIDDISLKAM